MDETGVEPMTSPMRRERATNCATRPIIVVVVLWEVALEVRDPVAEARECGRTSSKSNVLSIGGVTVSSGALLLP